MLMQVMGGTSAEWASLPWQQRPDLDAAALHGLQSGRIHIHLYLDGAASTDDQALADSRPEHPADDAAAARQTSGQDCSTSNGHSSTDARESWRRREQQQQQQLARQSSTSADNGSSMGNARTAEQPGGGGRKVLMQLDVGRPPPLPVLPLQRMAAEDAAGQLPGACERVDLPGRLALAAWVDLNALEPLGALSDLDSRVLPRGTLIFELSDGLYVWPPCAHMLRTASGAVPPMAEGGPAAAAAQQQPALPQPLGKGAPLVGALACWHACTPVG